VIAQDRGQPAALEVRAIRPGAPASGNKKANRTGSPFIPFEFQLLIKPAKPALTVELVKLSVYLIT
jgi:hypothetical protein